MGDGGPDIPPAFVPLANVIGDGPELQKRNTFLQTGEMKGSSLHAFNNGRHILLIPAYAGTVGADLIDGEASDLLYPGEIQKVTMGIDQEAVVKGGGIPIHQVEVEEGLKILPFLNAQVSEDLFFHCQDGADPARGETTRNSGLDYDVRSASANLTHKCINSGERADAGDEHVRFEAPGRGGAVFQQIDSGLNFKACGGCQYNVHAANICIH